MCYLLPGKNVGTALLVVEDVSAHWVGVKCRVDQVSVKSVMSVKSMSSQSYQSSQSCQSSQCRVSQRDEGPQSTLRGKECSILSVRSWSGRGQTTGQMPTIG